MLWDCSSRLTNQLDIVSDGWRVFWYKSGNILKPLPPLPPPGMSDTVRVRRSVTQYLLPKRPEQWQQSVHLSHISSDIRADRQTWMLSICTTRITSPGLPMAPECSMLKCTVWAPSLVLCLVVIYMNILLSYIAIIFYPVVIWASWTGSFRTLWK